MLSPSAHAAPLSQNPPTSRSFLEGTETHGSPQRVQVQPPPPLSRPLPPKVEQRDERVLLEDAVLPTDGISADGKSPSLVFAILRCMKDDELRLPGAARLILLAYSMYANPDDEAWPAVETIAKFTGMSERAARDMISKLADLGWLEHVDSWKGGRLTARYIVRLNGKDFATWTQQLHEERLRDLEARQAARPSVRKVVSSRTIPTPRPMPAGTKQARKGKPAQEPLSAAESPPAAIPEPIATDSAALGCEICPPGGRDLPPWDAKSAADRSGSHLRPTNRSEGKRDEEKLQTTGVRGRDVRQQPALRPDNDWKRQHVHPKTPSIPVSLEKVTPIDETCEPAPETPRCPESPARASKPISKPPSSPPSWIPTPTEPTAQIATPEDLLSWVAPYPCLRSLLQDPMTAKRWAEDQAGIFAMAATRGEDVFNAIRSFVAGNSEAAHDMQRLQLVKALGTYLSNAKKFGDVDRAKKAKDAAHEKASGGVSNRNKYLNPRDIRQTGSVAGAGNRMQKSQPK